MIAHIWVIANSFFPSSLKLGFSLLYSLAKSVSSGDKRLLAISGTITFNT
jgi:hypothetical protein